MFFVLKTPYSFSTKDQDRATTSLGSLFIHNTGSTENKICPFGKVMAISAVVLAFIRVYFIKSNKNTVTNMSLVFIGLCVLLAAVMNMNALVYISPLLLSEIYILYTV